MSKLNKPMIFWSSSFLSSRRPDGQMVSVSDYETWGSGFLPYIHLNGGRATLRLPIFCVEYFRTGFFCVVIILYSGLMNFNKFQIVDKHHNNKKTL